MTRSGIITRVSLCVAMLISSQLALGSITGIEIVSVILAAFSFSFGVPVSLLTATAFSLLRCFVFGSYINIIFLYLIYYNLFALYFAWLGKKISHNLGFREVLIAIISSVIFTVCFTLLDDVLTPLFYGFSKAAAYAYFYASLYAMLTHTICVGITVATLFKPLTFVLSKIKSQKQ